MMNTLPTTEEIKQLVSIEQVLSLYGIEAVNKRIPCPIHNGKDKNFSIHGDTWTYFVCNKSGDIFSLVQALSNCDFKEAKAIICDRFNLQGRASTKAEYKARIERQNREREQEKAVQSARELQYSRICETALALKGTPAEAVLKPLIEKFRTNKDFILSYDVHALLTNLIKKYGDHNPMIILTDLNKEKPFLFTGEKYQVATLERDCLNFGDYSLKGFDKEIAVISKNIEELANMILKVDIDAWHEVLRYELCALVLECSYMDIAKKKYTADIVPHSVLQYLNTLAVKYKVHIFYCDNEKGAEYQTYYLLDKFLQSKKDYLEKVLLHDKA